MINEAQLREMSPGERHELAHALAVLDYPSPLAGLNWPRGRKFGFLVSVLACIVLVGWIVVLALTLQRHYVATHWRFAWIGFDVILLTAFALTGWAIWRGRQIVIACMLVTGTLLCCDAWFDVILDLGTSGIWESLASAAIVELPMALLMFRAARRLIRLSALVAMSARGDDEPVGSLWSIPLLGLPIGLSSPGGTTPRTPRGGPDRKDRDPIGPASPGRATPRAPRGGTSGDGSRGGPSGLR